MKDQPGLYVYCEGHWERFAIRDGMTIWREKNGTLVVIPGWDCRPRIFREGTYPVIYEIVGCTGVAEL